MEHHTSESNEIKRKRWKCVIKDNPYSSVSEFFEIEPADFELGPNDAILDARDTVLKRQSGYWINIAVWQIRHPGVYVEVVNDGASKKFRLVAFSKTDGMVRDNNFLDFWNGPVIESIREMESTSITNSRYL